jgi:ribose transport system substrate-binding protein
MSSQRVWLWTIALIAIVAAVGYRMSVFREPPPPPPAKVLFITGGSGSYWQLTVNGAQAAAREHNVNLQVETPAEDESLAEQMAILIRVDGAQLDGIALSPVDAESQTRVINQLARATNVVTFDSDAELSDRQSHVGASNFAAGRACARMVSDAIPGGGKVAVLLANLTKENLIDRRGGFQESIERMSNDVEQGASEPRFTVVGYFEDNGDDEKCAQNIRDVVAANSDLAGIVGMNARHGPILLEVLGELNKLGKIKLVTFDALDETLDGIEAGHIYATIAQDPFKYGYEAVNILATLARGDVTEIPIVGRGCTYIGFEPILQENLESYRGRLRRRSGGTADRQPDRDVEEKEAV